MKESKNHDQTVPAVPLGQMIGAVDTKNHNEAAGPKTGARRVQRDLPQSKSHSMNP